jgi:hypothetical protein
VKLNKVRRPGLAPLKGPPTMLDWVRRLPGRTWDPDRNAWVVTALGADPDLVLAAAGFTVDLARAARAGVAQLSDLLQPWVELATEVPARLQVGVGLGEGHAVIWPRMAGYDKCLPSVPAAARWVKDPGCWVAQTADLASVTGLPVPAHVRELALELHAARIVGGADAATAALSAELARATHIDDVRGTADALIATLGDVPGWFGFDLFGYQAAGALAVAAGHAYLVDEPGLGKTAQGLAAAAVRGCQRVVVICPPVVNTNWARETDRSHLVEHMAPALAVVQGNGPQSPPAAALPLSAHSLPSFDQNVKHATPERIVRIVAGRKEPELPRQGVVIVSDSLLAARPALLERIVRWAPDGVLVDEVHRAKTFESARSAASRTVATAVGAGLRVPITGTPVFSSPADIAAALAISGHLDTVFGGLSAFLDRYCVQNFFGAWVARSDEAMAELRGVLEARVWTRRTKADVLPDLPPKFRSGVFLDVDLAGFRAAHADVEAKVEEWLDQFQDREGRLPFGPEPGDGDPAGAGTSEVETWARGAVGLISPLRRAAGLAKVEPAVERIREHVEATTERGPGGRPVYTRPLVVWVHHRDVGDAMAAAVPQVAARTEVIRGGTSADQRGRIVDAFQAGLVPVLVASISAAGVGITLTAGCDALFVETDWVVSAITQAEDRQDRISQTRPVQVTTLIAVGTLDERIQGVLQKKTVLLDQLLPGGDNAPAIAGLDGADGKDVATPAGIITDLASGLMAARGKRKRKRAA